MIPTADEIMLMEKYSHLLGIDAQRAWYLLFSKRWRAPLPQELVLKTWEYM